MKKALKFLSLGMAIAMCLTMTPTAVFAATTTQDVTTDGSYGVNVSVINASTYTVTIPKTLSVTDADTISYNVSVSGDIAGTEQVVVTPDANVVLSSYNKDDVTAGISQNQTTWTYDEFVTQAIGTIDVSGTTAGEWNGKFNFNISLEATNEMFSFYIQQTDDAEPEEYHAVGGMTWEDWLASEYNQLDCGLSGDFICRDPDDGRYLSLIDGEAITIDMQIISSYTYIWA